MQRLKTVLKAWPVITIVAMFLSFATKELAYDMFGVTLQSQSSVKSLKMIAGFNMQFLQFTAAVLVFAPVLEEFIFRYLFWKLPDPRRIWIAAIPSGILFVAAHYLKMPWPDNAFLALFFFAIAQCWVYKTTGRLWCIILTHALFNATNLILVLALPEKYLVS